MTRASLVLGVLILLGAFIAPIWIYNHPLVFALAAAVGAFLFTRPIAQTRSPVDANLIGFGSAIFAFVMSCLSS